MTTLSSRKQSPDAVPRLLTNRDVRHALGRAEVHIRKEKPDVGVRIASAVMDALGPYTHSVKVVYRMVITGEIDISYQGNEYEPRETYSIK